MTYQNMTANVQRLDGEDMVFINEPAANRAAQQYAIAGCEWYTVKHYVRGSLQGFKLRVRGKSDTFFRTVRE